MNFRDFVENFFRPDGTTESESGYLYHATNEENLSEIKASGFLDVFDPFHGTEQEFWPDGAKEKRSYWTARAASAWQFAPEFGLPVILRTPKSAAFKKEAGTGDYYTNAAIPADFLEVKTADGSWVAIHSI